MDSSLYCRSYLLYSLKCFYTCPRYVCYVCYVFFVCSLFEQTYFAAHFLTTQSPAASARSHMTCAEMFYPINSSYPSFITFPSEVERCPSEVERWMVGGSLKINGMQQSIELNRKQNRNKTGRGARGGGEWGWGHGGLAAGRWEQGACEEINGKGKQLN